MRMILLVTMAAAGVFAQERTLNCDDNRRNSDNGRRQTFCEMREFPSAAAARMVVDGRTNGGINVKGWDRSDTLVRAQVTTWSPSLDDARALSKQVTVQ